MLNSLRQERGVPAPQRQEERHVSETASEPQRANHHVADNVDAGAGKPPSERTERTPPEAISEAQTEWYKREQAVRAAEEKVREATTQAEKRAADAEKREAEAKAAVQRMEWAKDDPVAFLAETGMTQEEWSSFLANGGKLSPEQKRLKAMEKQLQETRSAMEQMEKEARRDRELARRAAEESQFAAKLQNMLYVPEAGGMAAVRHRQQLLSQQTGREVSLEDAANNLEQALRGDLERILKSPKIRSSLGLDVNTPDAGQAAERPRTLNKRVAAESGSPSAKPHPLDFKAKMKLYQQRVERERSAQGR